MLSDSFSNIKNTLMLLKRITKCEEKKMKKNNTANEKSTEQS